ncbi:unnamed protein product [Calypogeia fissa]
MRRPVRNRARGVKGLRDVARQDMRRAPGVQIAGNPEPVRAEPTQPSLRHGHDSEPQPRGLVWYEQSLAGSDTGMVGPRADELYSGELVAGRTQNEAVATEPWRTRRRDQKVNRSYDVAPREYEEEEREKRHNEVTKKYNEGKSTTKRRKLHSKREGRKIGIILAAGGRVVELESVLAT